MISDDERYRLAYRMRQLDSLDDLYLLVFSEDCPSEIEVQHMPRRTFLYNLFNRLADLIEPQSDENNFEPDNMFRDFPDWFNEHMGGWDKW